MSIAMRGVRARKEARHEQDTAATLKAARRIVARLDDTTRRLAELVVELPGIIRREGLDDGASRGVDPGSPGPHRAGHAAQPPDGSRRG